MERRVGRTSSEIRERSAARRVRGLRVRKAVTRPVRALVGGTALMERDAGWGAMDIWRKGVAVAMPGEGQH